jgi:hypothetical protein
MAEGKMTSAWDHTAAILAKLHNVNCTKPNQMIKNPTTLNPMRVKQKKGGKADMTDLAAMMGATGLTRGPDRRPIKPVLPKELQPDFVVED